MIATVELGEYEGWSRRVHAHPQRPPAELLMLRGSCAPTIPVHPRVRVTVLMRREQPANRTLAIVRHLARISCLSGADLSDRPQAQADSDTSHEQSGRAATC